MSQHERSRHERADAALLDGFSPRDRALLARLLGKLAAQLEHDQATRTTPT